MTLFLIAETPTNEMSIEEPFPESRVTVRVGGSQDPVKEGEDEDLFSGTKEMFEQSEAIKKSIQYHLGRRSGPRWSLPHQYIGT